MNFTALGACARKSRAKADLICNPGERPSGQCCEEIRGSGIVAERFADVGEEIDIARAEDETAAELKGVLPQFVLVVTGAAGSLSGDSILTSKQMKQVGGFQLDRFIGLALFVDQKREGDPGLFAELPRVDAVSETNRREGCALVAKSLIVSAQLRDVLAAEDSSIVAQKNDNSGLLVPQRAKANFAAFRVRESDERQPFAERIVHRRFIMRSGPLPVKQRSAGRAA